MRFYLYIKKAKKLIKNLIYNTKKYWSYDPNHKFHINNDEVKKYFNNAKVTPLSIESERSEEQAIMNLVNIRPGMEILDLGCGEGRWAKVLKNRDVKYVGVDFSDELINKARKKNIDNNVKFISKTAQDFISDNKFDFIFIFGLITYMNDEDIRKLSKNCRVMLKNGGKLILRDVALSNEVADRRVYDDKQNLFKKIFFREPRYQLIRRSTSIEEKLFKEFSPIHKQIIDGTNLIITIFK